MRVVSRPARWGFAETCIFDISRHVRPQALHVLGIQSRPFLRTWALQLWANCSRRFSASLPGTAIATIIATPVPPDALQIRYSWLVYCTVSTMLDPNMHLCPGKISPEMPDFLDQGFRRPDAAADEEEMVFFCCRLGRGRRARVRGLEGRGLRYQGVEVMQIRLGALVCWSCSCREEVVEREDGEAVGVGDGDHGRDEGVAGERREGRY